LRRLTGVESVTVALIAGTAEVRYDGARLLPTQIAQYITDIGYPSSLIELARQDRVELLVRSMCARTGHCTSVQITGMTCGSCVHRIESHLAAIKGVEKAVVNLATKLVLFARRHVHVYFAQGCNCRHRTVACRRA
jgi:Cu+-exporting ATPase